MRTELRRAVGVEEQIQAQARVLYKTTR